MVSNRRSLDDGISCCSHGFFKLIMLFFALLTMTCGGLFLLLSAYLFVVKYYIVPLLHTEMYMYCIYLMCACGSLCIISGFLSCSAARTRCGNVSYFFVMMLIISLEGLLAYTAIYYSSHTAQNIGERLKNDIKHGYTDREDIRWAIDKLQIEGKCCGAQGFTDYPKNETSPESEEEEEENGRRKPEPQYIPDSCCRDYKPGCGKSDHPSNIYYDGCQKVFEREIHNSMYFINTATFAFLIVQALATLITLCVCASWKDRTPAPSFKHGEQQLLFD